MRCARCHWFPRTCLCWWSRTIATGAISGRSPSSRRGEQSSWPRPAAVTPVENPRRLVGKCWGVLARSLACVSIRPFYKLVKNDKLCDNIKFHCIFISTLLQMEINTTVKHGKVCGLTHLSFAHQGSLQLTNSFFCTHSAVCGVQL